MMRTHILAAMAAIVFGVWLCMSGCSRNDSDVVESSQVVTFRIFIRIADIDTGGTIESELLPEHIERLCQILKSSGDADGDRKSTGETSLNDQIGPVDVQESARQGLAFIQTACDGSIVQSRVERESDEIVVNGNTRVLSEEYMDEVIEIIAYYYRNNRDEMGPGTESGMK